MSFLHPQLQIQDMIIYGDKLEFSVFRTWNQSHVLLVLQAGVLLVDFYVALTSAKKT